MSIPHPHRPRAVFSAAGRSDPSTVPGVLHCFSLSSQISLHWEQALVSPRPPPLYPEGPPRKAEGRSYIESTFHPSNDRPWKSLPSKDRSTHHVQSFPSSSQGERLGPDWHLPENTCTGEKRAQAAPALQPRPLEQGWGVGMDPEAAAALHAESGTAAALSLSQEQAEPNPLRKTPHQTRDP